MRPHWDRKAEGWDRHLPRSSLFGELLEAVMEAVRPTGHDVALDLGAGTGFLTVPLAERAGRVYAVDHSAAMLERLGHHLGERGLRLKAVRTDLRRFAPPEPVDVVVSNYALHHHRGRAKARLLADCRGWMRPGGRIAVADLMVPLSLRPGRSGPLVATVRDMARRGPSGYWRIAKNAGRWVLGRGEYPASLQTWMATLADAGFVSVGGTRIGTHSGVAWGRTPGVRLGARAA